MIGRDGMRVLSAAHAIALQARVGGLGAVNVRQLDGFAREVLGADHPAALSVQRFVSGYAQARFDRAALVELGEELQRDVLRLLRPAPVDAGRIDIHG